MRLLRHRRHRRWFVPEAVQTSAMDCGPAALKALLEGFGIPVSYGRLREACQTGVDGTSIDSLETAARQLGIDAQQVMLPADHLCVKGAESLPALVVVRLPSGMTHFVVAWRRFGPWVQIMDPATGRRWTTVARFTRELYLHTQPVPAEVWRDWAGSPAYANILARRLQALGLSTRQSADAIHTATADPGWRPLARLDAAARLVAQLITRGALPKGSGSANLLARLALGDQPIPTLYWPVQLDPTDPEQVLLMRGAVLLQAQSRLADAPDQQLSPELQAALHEPAPHPLRALARMLLADGAWQPVILATALLSAALGVTVEAILWRGLLDLARDLTLTGQRISALYALFGFLGLLLALDFALTRGAWRLGRHLECRWRQAFCAKIPRLHDRYFQSRPISDMAQRSQSIYRLRQAPGLAAQFLRAVCEMSLTVAGIAWLYPAAAPWAAAAAVCSLGIPLAAQPLLAERDLRLRSHTGALTRFYLDALLGLTAIRAHGAERALRREQESLLGEWASAGLGLYRLIASVEALQLSTSLLLVIWLLWHQVQLAGANPGGLLLLIYWVLNLPALGQEAAGIAWQYPWQRNATLRLLEPLGAPEEPITAAPATLADPLTIRFEHVHVLAAGHTILEDIDLDLPAGSHVGIVGPSGAGKSSLAGLLLGWHKPTSGRVLINGQPLDAARLEALRRVTAWVDPQVQLWNRSLLANLQYGNPPDNNALDGVLDGAELSGVLRQLPDGLQTTLGEGGALVSGGEGQRIRFGRALAREDVRLVILDEPARGLDRSRRRALLERARERWPGAILLCITHDVSDTREFDRVLVVESSRIVEDGCPAQLAANPDSRYRALLDAEDAVRRGLWASASWRRLRMQAGTLVEECKTRRSAARASH